MSPRSKSHPMKLGGVFGLVHAMVDFVTVSVAFTVSRIYGIPFVYGLSVIVLYDIIAFAGQAIIGFIVDRTRTYKTLVLLGIVLTALSVPLLSISPVAAAVCTAVGNACFHVGAGALSLRAIPGRAAVPGIFVAPGAIGLGLATMLGKSRIFFPWPLVLLMILAFAAVLLLRVPGYEARVADRRPIPKPYLITALLLASVAIRALVGFGGSFNCSKTFSVKIALMTVAFLGKGLGGIICDRVGWVRGCMAALLLSMPLIAFLGHLPVPLITGFLLFQMTMPVTLVAVERIMPDRPGLAFGLCCLALVAGSLLAFSKDVQSLYSGWFFVALISASAAMLYYSLKHLQKNLPTKF
jgi:FSR family fosmidomycin resistance protein-like MFS transporter